MANHRICLSSHRNQQSTVNIPTLIEKLKISAYQSKIKFHHQSSKNSKKPPAKTQKLKNSIGGVLAKLQSEKPKTFEIFEKFLIF